MIFGNILWKQHELSKFLKNTDKLSLSLYSNPIYKWDGDIFANKNISHSFNYIKDECLYLTFPVYKGSV